MESVESGAEAAVPRVRNDSFLTLHYRIAALEETPNIVETAPGMENAGEADGGCAAAEPNGIEFVSTFDLSPATLQLGCGQLAPTLEACLIDLPAGTRKTFRLPPEEAFGARNPRLVERIARDALPPEIELAENSLVEFSTPDGGTFTGFLRQLDARSALFDFNHPLAGKYIEFEVWILAVL